MVNLFLIGYLSFMDLELSTNVKYVVTIVTGEEELLKDISQNGGK